MSYKTKWRDQMSLFIETCRYRSTVFVWLQCFDCCLQDSYVIGLSKERPILGDNRKAHSEKRCAFHEKQHWKPDPKGRCVLNQLFSMISGAFHMKSAILFTKSAAFHEKHCFSWKVPLFERPLARNCNPMFLVCGFNRYRKLSVIYLFFNSIHWFYVKTRDLLQLSDHPHSHQRCQHVCI